MKNITLVKEKSPKYKKQYLSKRWYDYEIKTTFLAVKVPYK